MVDVIGHAKVVVSSVVDTASVGRTGGSIGDVLKKGALVGGAALAGLAAVGVDTYKAFEEAEAQSRKLNRVLDNMGESKAGPALEKLADTLMRQTGIDDEVIKGGETILATFDAVAESAGKVGGTFDRATRVAVDMSSVFGSVESASRVLGKALSDPEKAAQLLRRSNVILNDEQKKLIKNFLDAGNQAGAQDVILKALEQRYKGTAEASSKESQKISTAFGELKENVGQIVADLVSALAGEDKKGKKRSLSSSIYEVSDAVDKFSKSPSWNQLQGQISDTAELVGEIVGPVSKVVGWFDKLEKKSPELAGAIKLLIDPLSNVKQLLKGIGDAYNAVKDFFDNPPADNPFAHGDTSPRMGRTRRASGGFTRGLTLVNENGPELIDFGSSGGYVYNNSQTREMLAGAGGGSFTYAPQYFGPVSGSDILAEYKWANRFAPRFGALTATVAG